MTLSPSGLVVIVTGFTGENQTMEHDRPTIKKSNLYVMILLKSVL